MPSIAGGAAICIPCTFLAHLPSPREPLDIPGDIHAHETLRCAVPRTISASTPARKTLQKVLGVVPGGWVGERTPAAVKDHDNDKEQLISVLRCSAEVPPRADRPAGRPANGRLSRAVLKVFKLIHEVSLERLCNNRSLAMSRGCEGRHHGLLRSTDHPSFAHPY